MISTGIQLLMQNVKLWLVSQTHFWLLEIGLIFFIMKMCRTRLTVNVPVDFHSDPGMQCIIRLKENKVDNDKANRESILVDMDGRCNTSFDAVKITNKIHCK